MRKQAKLVAVLSAAALLAVGASMTSFAATPHWDMEDGEWVYLDRNGDKVTDVWKSPTASGIIWTAMALWQRIRSSRMMMTSTM